MAKPASFRNLSASALDPPDIHSSPTHNSPPTTPPVLEAVLTPTRDEGSRSHHSTPARRRAPREFLHSSRSMPSSPLLGQLPPRRSRGNRLKICAHCGWSMNGSFTPKRRVPPKSIDTESSSSKSSVPYESTDSEEEEEEEEEGDSCKSSGTERRTRKRPRKTKRRQPMSGQEKLRATSTRQWKPWRWSVQDYIWQLYLHRDAGKEFQHLWKKFQNWLCTPNGRCMWQDLTPEEQQTIFQAFGGWEYVCDQLETEFAELGQLPTLGKWDAMKEDSNTTEVQNIGQDVTTHAPLFSSILFNLSCNDRTLREAKNPVKTYEDDRFARKVAIIVSILLFHQHTQTHNRFPINLGLVLLGAGVGKRPISILNGMGLVPVYRTIADKRELLKEHAVKQVREAAQHYPNVIVAYDNFEFTNELRHERVGRASTFESVTSVMMCIGPNGKKPALSQQLRLENHVVDPCTIFRHMAPPEIQHQHEKFFIRRTLQRIFPQLVIEGIYQNESLPQIKSDNLVPEHVTTILPLKTILLSESTTSNTLQIIDDIYLDQLGRSRDETTWASSVSRIIGDLKTVNLLQSCVGQRGQTSEGVYDNLKWIQPVQGLFHTTMNYLQAIHQAHWGLDDRDTEIRRPDASTLSHACSRLGRRKAASGKLFKPCEELLLDAFDAKVIAFAIVAMPESERPSESEFISISSFRGFLSRLDKASFESYIDTIHQNIFQADVSINGALHDDEFTSHVLFLRHMLPYQLLIYSIKRGDLDLLREALRRCTIIFQAPENRKRNYARESIRFMALIDGEAALPELADAILTSALVNTQGRRDTFKATDLHMEHLNLQLRNCLHDLRSNFDKRAFVRDHPLIAPYLAQMSATFDATLGKIHSGAHTVKEARDNVFTLGAELARSSVRRRLDRIGYQVPDLWASGMEQYPENCLKYNRKRNQDWDLDDDDPDEVEPLSLDLDGSLEKAMVAEPLTNEL